MKVEKSSVSSASYASAASSYGKGSKRAEAVEAPSDSVEVSVSGSLFQRAVDSLRQAPDIRSEAISGIQREFAEGTYHRDEREVAKKVIDESLNSF
ncbi:Flagellar biosynthesis anti-sigma factor FlgM [Sulfidibacter corallicola]|uniref:Flagellar biosynthesis anti-sigma factor FlgM n=1 Tax=Sulfidibacter corallicola TaxID=2818388 RepID=A0A8A4TXL7_SULCO|nr:flagellar biosynthesis anti-sigma factor FlgM [Sulfidibacter corallicola]QTD53951.1 flagellar biosynthesis anti-sigma factor FlgM [Sulfidibacter corallicola]